MASTPARLSPLHTWNLEPEQAMRVQAHLRQHLVLAWDKRAITTVGGIDVSFAGEQAHATIAVLSYPGLELLTAVTVSVPLTFPYIPGLLAFREGPAILAAWEKLTIKPDLAMFDGQGIAHPRGLGIASHMGLWIEKPTIGVAKSRLYGRHGPLGEKPGDRCELRDERDPRQIIGAVLRTREKTNPLYISPGHLIDLEHAVQFVLACCRGYRLPEPTRWAHKISEGAQPPDKDGMQYRLF